MFVLYPNSIAPYLILVFHTSLTLDGGLFCEKLKSSPPRRGLIKKRQVNKGFDRLCVLCTAFVYFTRQRAYLIFVVTKVEHYFYNPTRIRIVGQ